MREKNCLAPELSKVECEIIRVCEVCGVKDLCGGVFE